MGVQIILSEQKQNKNEKFKKLKQKEFSIKQTKLQLHKEDEKK